MTDIAEPLSLAGLPWRQRKILEVIEGYQRDHGCSPSNRDIAAGAGLASSSTVSYHLQALKAAGWVTYDPRCRRTVRVLRPVHPAALPANAIGETAAGTTSEEVVRVPILGRIAAGSPILAQQTADGYLPLPTELVGREEGLFILEVVGDSMIGVGIFPGDWVVLRRLVGRPHNGDIVAATIEGMEVEGTVKTYKKVGNRVWLMPQNPAYTPITGDRAKFAGKVVAVMRQV
jgi:repressor LexA